MTAPALPGAAPDPARLPPEVDAAIRNAIDSAMHSQRIYDNPALGADEAVEANRARLVTESRLRTAIARALGGDGEPVAWGMLDGSGAFRLALSSRRAVEDEADRRNRNDDNDENDKRNTVVPLYTHPAAAYTPRCEGCDEPATTTDVDGVNLCSLCAAKSAAGGNP